MSTKNNDSIKVVDLFAGAGGFGLGFKIADYHITHAVEVDKWACDTLRVNHKQEAIVIEDDITHYQTKDEVLSVCDTSPDVIIGGPPCQGFSVAGPAKKDPKDPRNSLFIDFARWVGYLHPHIFVMENVKGILSRKNANGEKVADIIKQTFENLGYSVEIWVLNAAKYGVPQLRERVFFVGNRYDSLLGKPSATHYLWNGNTSYELDRKFIELKKAVSVGEAILDLPFLDAGTGEEEQEYTKDAISDYQKWARGQQTKLYNHAAMKHTSRIVERFKQIQKGNLISELPSEYRVRKRSGNGELSSAAYHSNYRHLKKNSISYTIPASFYSSFIHPIQPRNITAREAARLQSFPDWYRFMGKRTIISSKLLQKQGRVEHDYLSQYNQIGNAVPPLLAKAIANHIKAFLQEHSLI